ncbi:MAG: peptide/nickel transport system substrate-binding protein [Acetobacteraceae bacterium]|nr:peptide/nickel transport system substrate-binding protein [Acetobacteraceae bacterium]
MQRRSFLTGAGAATALAQHRAVAQTGKTRVLRYVPQADLTVIDPVMTTAYITRYHSTMVWDQLYGIDSKLQPQPQMVEGHTVEDDGRLWTFTLRDNLRFHDGEPVRGRDCVASVKRWAVRDPMGQALLTRVAEMTAPDDRRFTIRLTRPFNLVLNCLSKIGPPTLVVMPERLANTDPFQAIKEVVGSGPYRFVASERVVGNKVVYTRNADYVPRPNGTPDWLAGPKVVNFDRVEWTVMPDPATAAAALQNGEIDWWENPPNDLLPMLNRSANVRTEDTGPLGVVGTGVLNHLHPPFDKPAVRRVMLQAISQTDFMTAAAGTDPAMWRDGVGVFTPNTPMASKAGMEIMAAAKPDLAVLAKALRDAGYKGERIVLMSPSDQAVLTAQCNVAMDLMQKLGMKVDLAVMDWGTLVQRRASKEPPEKGGWNMFITGWNGLDTTTPITHQTLRSNGAKAWFGWPDLPPVQSLIDAWLEAADVPSQQKIAAELQAKALELVPYLPTGQYFYRTACRTDITGIIPGQFVFWNVRRT